MSKQNKQMNIKDKLAHCLIEVDFGGMNTTVLDYGAVEELLEKTISQTRQEAVLDYILSLGWQDTENEYVKEVIDDADKISKSLSSKEK